TILLFSFWEKYGEKAMSNDESLLSSCVSILHQILNGKVLETQPLIELAHYSDEETAYVSIFNIFLKQYQEAWQFINMVCNGYLDVTPPVSNRLFDPFKQLHSELLHLVWQTKHLAEGDLNQHVEFMGDFSIAFNSLIQSLRERKYLSDKLRQSENYYKTLISAAPDGICVLTLDGVILNVSQKGAEIFGYSSPADLTGKNLFEAIIPDHRPKVSSFFQEMAKGIRTGLGEYQITDRHGNIIWNESNGELLRKDNGEPEAIILIFRDINQKKLLEHELFKTSQLESLGILAGGIAHDFNNLLAAILLNLQLASLKLQKQQDISKQLEDTITTTRKASDLTKQLLTFSHGGNPIKRSMPIVNLIKETVQFALCGSNVKPQFYFEENLCVVEIDECQIIQVINNLTINAKQAMPDGGILEVTSRNIFCDVSDKINPGQYAKLTIKDHGIGIPSEILPKIFDPFFTTKKTGNGLGLTTSYSIIKKTQRVYRSILYP
ncbi:MAG TPA: PAS domain S-box protein, partial [Bacillota bacterium]|nr:PAS domain S-box protein [Bacillota bacterium]